MTLTIDELMSVGAAIAIADRTGMFVRLREGPATLEELASPRDADGRMAKKVLSVLEAFGLLRFDEAKYALDPSTAATPALQLGGPGQLTDRWMHLERMVRDGAPAMMRETKDRDRTYGRVVLFLETLLDAAARRLAAVLAARSPKRVLDVGAGSGVWSLALLERCPECSVVGLDLPQVLPRFEARATERGLAGRAVGRAGDYFEVPLDASAFDTIIVGSVLHLEAPARAKSLLTRLRPALAPGGAIVIADMLMTDTTERRQAVAAYALELALRVEGGQPHAAADIRRWLEELGLAVGDAIPLDEVRPTGMGALIGASSPV